MGSNFVSFTNIYAPKCHTREDGDPAHKYLAAIPCSYSEAPLTRIVRWIPAFAGMTFVGLVLKDN